MAANGPHRLRVGRGRAAGAGRGGAVGAGRLGGQEQPLAVPAGRGVLQLLARLKDPEVGEPEMELLARNSSPKRAEDGVGHWGNDHRVFCVSVLSNLESQPLAGH